MGRTVLADEPGAVDGEAHRKPLQSDIMNDLIIGALQEGRIDRTERLEALDRETGSKGHGVLLGDADIEHAAREAGGELVEAGARRHGGGDGDDLLVLLGLADQRLARRPT